MAAKKKAAKKTAKKTAKKAAPKKTAPKAPPAVSSAEGFSAAFVEGGASAFDALRRRHRGNQRKPLTPAEVEAERVKAMNLIVARASVIEASRGAPHASGHRNCIVCGKGDLRYTVENGHVTLDCSTPGCVHDRGESVP